MLEVLGVFLRFGFTGGRMVRGREGLDLWYGERRADPGLRDAAEVHAPRTLVVAATVARPARDAFELFSRPEHASRWFSTRHEAELRPGGRYRNADGDCGEFIAVDPPHRLEFTWENPGHCPGTLVEVEFRSPTGDATAVTLRHHRLASAEHVAEMRRGWSWALDSFKSFAESGEPISFERWCAEQDARRAALGGLGSADLQPTLEGELVLLRPLREDDFEPLLQAASDPLIWEQHPQRERWRREVFTEYFRGGIASGGAFAVIERASGRIIGSTRFHGLDPATREIEIGWTFLTRAHWGGRFNHEMKRLLLDHAFTIVDRVLFLVGPANIRSQTAVQRIGGVRQGTRRDDTGLESVVFRIDAADWSARRS